MVLPSLKSLINDTKPGRSRRVKSSRSKVIVGFRVTADEARAAERTARRQGMTLGEFARKLFLDGTVRR